MASDLPSSASAPQLLTVQNVRHGFFNRHGGVSTGSVTGLNLSDRLGDDRAAVALNRQRVLLALQKPEARFVALKQVHGDAVVQVTADAGPNIEADGLFTRDPKAALAIFHADCVPILFAARDGRTVGAVHSGWRGTAARIAQVMLRRLSDIGVPPKDIVVALGPAIGPCCFEVGPEVVQAMAAVIAVSKTAPVPCGEAHEGKKKLDLWAINVALLQEAGVLSEHIDVLRHCTVCDAAYYSYRREGGLCGRQAAVIALKS